VYKNGSLAHIIHRITRNGGNHMGNKALDYTALTISIIGAVNWGLIGFFDFNLVSFLFGSMSWLSRIIYALVGLCGLYLLSFYSRSGSQM
jgi:hypothetical protein